MRQYFPKPFRSFGGNINVKMLKLIFQIIQQKTDLKNVAHVDTSSFALKTNFATFSTLVTLSTNLSNKVDKLISASSYWVE